MSLSTKAYNELNSHGIGMGMGLGMGVGMGMGMGMGMGKGNGNGLQMVWPKIKDQNGTIPV